MTLASAGTFWCPIAQVAIGGTPPVTGNRVYDQRRPNASVIPPNCYCVGNICPKWNWTDDSETTATCGL